MKITLFYNPTAGGDGLPLKDLEKSFKKRGAKVTVQNTKKEGYANALDKDADFVVVAGGDGTIEKVSHLMVGKSIPIAILPFGNANNIANSLEVETALDKIFQNWETGEFSKFSVGALQIDQEEKFFFESVGWGMFASTLYEIKSDKKKGKKKSSGKDNKKEQSGMKKLMQSLDDLEPSFHGVILDGVDHSGDYLWVEIMNTQSMGPLLQLAPEAKHDDGFLDVVLVEEGEREALRKFLEAQPNGNVMHDFKTLKIKTIRVNSREVVHIDDEVYQPKDTEDNWVEARLLTHYFEIINA